MPIIISKLSFFDVLQKAYPLIPLKTSLQILSNFRLQCKKTTLEIIATDLDQSIHLFTAVDGEENFDITVNARKLFEIIREFPDGKVTFSVHENVLVLQSEKNFKCKIAGADSHDFPGLPEISSATEFEISSPILKNLIPKSIFAVAKDESRACLSGILWEIHPDRTGMVATDGHRLGSCFIEENFSVSGKISGIISPKSLNHLARILDSKPDESIRISINEKYISFSSKTFNQYSKLIEGPYPDYNKVIPISNSKEALIDRMSLINAVKRASVLSNQKTHLVKFVFTDNMLEVIVVNKEIGGEATEKIDIRYKGDNHTIGFNGQYFIEILEICKSEKVLLKMNTQISACLLFPSFDKEDQKRSEDIFLIMPLRIMDT